MSNTATDESPPPAPPAMSLMEGWPFWVGHFIMQFGVLESVVFGALQRALPAAEYERLKKQHLKDRLECLDGLITGGEVSGMSVEAWRDWLSRMEPMRELRNHVAHGYLVFEPLPGTETFQMNLLQTKDWGALGVRAVTYEELVSAASVVDVLISELHPVAGFAPLKCTPQPETEP